MTSQVNLTELEEKKEEEEEEEEEERRGVMNTTPTDTQTYSECEGDPLLVQSHGGVDVHTRLLQTLLQTQSQSVL